MKYVLNTGWLMSESVLRLLLATVAAVVVARYLGPTKLGLLSYAASLVALFTPIAGIGVRKTVTRDLVESPEARDHILGTAFVMRLCGVMVAFALLVSVTIALHNSREVNQLIFIIALGPLLNVLSLHQLYFHATVQARRAAFPMMIGAIVATVLKLLLVYFNAGLVLFAVVFPIEAGVAAIGMVIAYRNNGLSTFQWRVNRQRAGQLLRDSWPLMFSGLSVAIYMRIDQVMIKHMLDPEQLGHYAVAATFLTACYFVPSALTTSLFPSIIQAKSLNRDQYHHRLQTFYNLMAVLSIVMAAGLCLFAPVLVSVMFGSQYIPAVGPLRIIAWSLVATFLGMATSQYLVSENLTRISMARTLMGMSANVVLNVLLIPRFGIAGAAWATLIAYTLATWSIMFFTPGRQQGLMITLACLSLGLYKEGAGARKP